VNAGGVDYLVSTINGEGKMYKSAARNAQHRAKFAKEPSRRKRYQLPIGIVLDDKIKKRRKHTKRKIKVEENVTYYSGPRSANMEGVIVKRKNKTGTK
jgi:hypothetical protein